MEKMWYNITINFKGEKRWEEDKNLIYLSMGYFCLISQGERGLVSWSFFYLSRIPNPEIRTPLKKSACKYEKYISTLFLCLERGKGW